MSGKTARKLRAYCASLHEDRIFYRKIKKAYRLGAVAFR